MGRAVVAGSMTTTSPPTYASSDFINIVGTANITQGTGTIGFVHRVPQAKVRAADPASPVRLRPLVDRAGQTKRRCRRLSSPAPIAVRARIWKGSSTPLFGRNANLKVLELVVAGKVAARYEATVTVSIDATEIRTAALRAPITQGVIPGPADRSLRLEMGQSHYRDHPVGR
jgi:hypothetical protein